MYEYILLKLTVYMRVVPSNSDAAHRSFVFTALNFISRYRYNVALFNTSRVERNKAHVHLRMDRTPAAGTTIALYVRVLTRRDFGKHCDERPRRKIARLFAFFYNRTVACESMTEMQLQTAIIGDKS